MKKMMVCNMMLVNNDNKKRRSSLLQYYIPYYRNRPIPYWILYTALRFILIIEEEVIESEFSINSLYNVLYIWDRHIIQHYTSKRNTYIALVCQRLHVSYIIGHSLFGSSKGTAKGRCYIVYCTVIVGRFSNNTKLTNIIV